MLSAVGSSESGVKCVFIYPLAGAGAVVGMSFVHSKVT